MFALVMRTDSKQRFSDTSDSGVANVAEPPEDVLDAIRAACVTAIVDARNRGSYGEFGPVASVAAVNSPAQVVLSGHDVVVSAAITALRASGLLRKTARLPVSAAFHCALMQPAADALNSAIGVSRIAPAASSVLHSPQDAAPAERVVATLQPPSVPLVSNVDGRLVTDASQIRELLVASVTAPVRWAACARAALQGSDGSGRMVEDGVDETSFLELGSGSTLASLVRQQHGLASCPVRSVGTVDDVRAFAREGGSGRWRRGTHSVTHAHSTRESP